MLKHLDRVVNVIRGVELERGAPLPNGRS